MGRGSQASPKDLCPQPPLHGRLCAASVPQTAALCAWTPGSSSLGRGTEKRRRKEEKEKKELLEGGMGGGERKERMGEAHSKVPEKN